MRLVSSQERPPRVASKGFSSTGKAEVILVVDFVWNPLVELVCGAVAGFGKIAGNRAGLSIWDDTREDR